MKAISFKVLSTFPICYPLFGFAIHFRPFAIHFSDLLSTFPICYPLFGFDPYERHFRLFLLHPLSFIIWQNGKLCINHFEKWPKEKSFPDLSEKLF
jgi:hypothetical protein